MEKKTIKIFISSPGDVVDERQIAEKVIYKLGKEFPSVRLEALLWENMPLQVTKSFQDGINEIVNLDIVDIAVFILWSRLGTHPGNNYIKPDGSYYQSGTEYEYEMMREANKRSGGTPAILAYIKETPFKDVLYKFLEKDEDLEELRKQYDNAKNFIQGKFYDTKNNASYAYRNFQAPTSFEEMLTQHLRNLIQEKAGSEFPVEWERNPYVGLRSFEYEENAIFFGRKRSIEKIKRLIRNSAESDREFIKNTTPNNDTASVFILGESGSGKSSLVRAGLLPDIIDFGLNGHTEWNKPCDFTFSQCMGNLYNEIVKKLTDAFPNLANTAIGKDLIAGKEINFTHLSDSLVSEKSSIFFIDQFEELFTDPLITEEERIRALALLQGLASTHKIWLFFAMRSDFYHKFTAYPILLELKRGSVLYDLPKIRHSEFQEIVEEPAKKAGLKWERKNGEELNEQIINDISSGIDDLPLIEFALSELYNLRDENNQLTFEAYHKIGKINGAVIKYVDDFYNSLTEEDQRLFYKILSALITLSSGSENLYVRKTALREDLQKSEKYERLIDKLIDKHILISGKDANEHATVSIVHEVLISSWPVIQNWIKQEKYFIDINNHYENLSKYWIEHNQSKNDLLKEKESIKEAEYFLYTWKDYASKNVIEFLYASIKRKKKKSLPLVYFLLLIDLIFVILSVIKIIKKELVNGFEISIQYILMATVLLIYMIWKKLKAVPNFETINVSLIVWTTLLAISIISSLITTEKSVVIPLLIFLKLISVIIEKREIQQWGKRSFTRGFNLSMLFK